VSSKQAIPFGDESPPYTGVDGGLRPLHWGFQKGYVPLSLAKSFLKLTLGREQATGGKHRLAY